MNLINQYEHSHGETEHFRTTTRCRHTTLLGKTASQSLLDE